jgi:hypothetical protein
MHSHHRDGGVMRKTEIRNAVAGHIIAKPEGGTLSNVPTTEHSKYPTAEPTSVNAFHLACLIAPEPGCCVTFRSPIGGGLLRLIVLGRLDNCRNLNGALVSPVGIYHARNPAVSLQLIES